MRPILWANGATGLAVAVVGILQYHGLGFLGIPSSALPSATFVNRNLAAEYLVAAIPLAGLLFLMSRRTAALLFSGLSFSLMCVFLVYTRSRGAWVGLVVGMFGAGVLAAVWPGVRRPLLEAIRLHTDRRKAVMGAVFLAMSGLLSAVPAYRSTAEMQQRGLPHLTGSKSDAFQTAASIFRKDEGEYGDRSIRDRLAMWRNTLRMVADSPVLGVGPGGWKRAYPPYDRGATIGPQGTPRQPHNDYLWVAAEYGLGGLLCYLWLLAAGLRCTLDVVRDSDPKARIAGLTYSICLVAYMGISFFGFPKEQPQAIPYMVLGAAAGATYRPSTVRWRLGVRLGLALLALLIPLGAAALSFQHMRFDRHYLDAFYLGSGSEDWPGVLKEVEGAEGAGMFRPHILAFKGVALQRLGRYAEAEAAYLQALSLAPHAWRIHSGLGSAYLEQGRLEEASGHLQTALSICPGALDVQGKLAVIHQKKGDLALAGKGLRAVLMADPNDWAAHHYTGNLFVARGLLDSAVVYYRQALRLNSLPETQTNLADVLRMQGRFAEALTHYQEAARALPDNPFIQLGLGAALEGTGRLAEAGTAYREAIALRPGLAEGHLAAGNLSFRQGLYQEALGSYRTFLRLCDPGQVRFAKERIRRCEEETRR